MSQNPKIMIVDDFEMMRFLIKNTLNEMGYTQTEEASDGSEAIEKLLVEGSKIDIIFCDLNMPKTSGLQVLEFCRTFPSYEKVPFIMVTAEAEQQHVIKAIKAGANDYILKPIAPDALQKKLRGLFTKFFPKAA